MGRCTFWGWGCVFRVCAISLHTNPTYHLNLNSKDLKSTRARVAQPDTTAEQNSPLRKTYLMPMPKQQDGIPFQRANPVMKGSEAKQPTGLLSNTVIKKYDACRPEQLARSFVLGFYSFNRSTLYRNGPEQEDSRSHRVVESLNELSCDEVGSEVT